jgi:hypothetical protein
MKFISVMPCPIPIFILLGSKYSPQDPVLKYQKTAYFIIIIITRKKKNNKKSPCECGIEPPGSISH